MNFLFNLYWALDQLSFLPRNKQLLRKKRIELHNRIINRNRNKNIIVPVEEFHENYLTKERLMSLPHDRPVVFRGLGKKTRARQLWTFDFFKERYGDVQQPFFSSNGNSVQMDIMSVKDGLPDVLHRTPRRHLLGGPFDLLNFDKKLRSDMELEQLTDWTFFKNKFNHLYKLFFTGKDQWATTHTEFGDTINFVIKGKKRWTLFSPEDSPFLLPEVSRNIFIRSSMHANASRLRDEGAGLKIWDICLDEGDAIFCPSYFWHFIETSEDSISAEFKWGSIPMLMRHPFLTSVLLTATNPSMLGQFRRVADQSIMPPADIFN